MKICVVISTLVAGVLSGCASTYLDLGAEDCSSYGFVAGTPEFAGCVERRANTHKQELLNAVKNFSTHQSSGINASPQGPKFLDYRCISNCNNAGYAPQACNSRCSY